MKPETRAFLVTLALMGVVGVLLNALQTRSDALLAKHEMARQLEQQQVWNAGCQDDNHMVQRWAIETEREVMACRRALHKARSDALKGCNT